MVKDLLNICFYFVISFCEIVAMALGQAGLSMRDINASSALYLVLIATVVSYSVALAALDEAESIQRQVLTAPCSLDELNVARYINGRIQSFGQVLVIMMVKKVANFLIFIIAHSGVTPWN